MELAFGRGVMVKVGRGKAHVRFNDIPEQAHPVTPRTLRRIGWSRNPSRPVVYSRGKGVIIDAGRRSASMRNPPAHI
jgi:hypothetical protein